MELSRADLASAAGHVAGRRQDQLARIEQEIRQAQAEALGRVGERLQALLERLAAADARLEELRARSPGEPEEAAGEATLHAETEARNRLRDEAARLRHDLIIQREALGLRRHREVEECYPVPGRRRPSPGPADPRRGPT